MERQRHCTCGRKFAGNDRGLKGARGDDATTFGIEKSRNCQSLQKRGRHDKRT